VQPDADTWIANLGSLPLIGQPGERLLYNTGASVLGVLAARVTGRSFGEVVRTPVRTARDARHELLDAGDRPPRHRLPAHAGRPDRLGRTRRKLEPAARVRGRAARLVSTVDDLYAFARMFLGRGPAVLSPESLQAMTSDQLTDAQKARGGLGPDFFTARSWAFCQAVYAGGAFGWNGGYGSSWLVDPAPTAAPRRPGHGVRGRHLTRSIE
jgi:CubicO group peptidase (beta-lactamase class C family)